MPRFALTLGTIVRAAVTAAAAPDAAATRAMLGLAPDADLSGQGTWRPVPDGCGEGWIVAGDGTVAPPSPTLPAVLPRWQVRAELRARGLLDAVGAALAALPDPMRTSALEWWENGAEVHRTSPLYQQLAAALVPDAAERDAMWAAAAARSL